MNSPVAPSRSAEEAASAASRIAGVVLARIAAGGSSEPTIARDLRALLPKPPPEDVWKGQIGRLLVALGSAGQVTRDEFGLKLTDEGRAALSVFLGTRKDLPETWAQLRDGPLMAKALGIPGASQSRLKALAKADGLRMLIVEQHWKLKVRGKPSASRLRQALAMTALDRAFGNQVKNEVGVRSGLSPKASRLLAGQLSKKPRDFKTDARLIAALAAEAAGVTKPELAQLRSGILKRFLGELPATRIAAADPKRAPVVRPAHSPPANPATAVAIEPRPASAPPQTQVAPEPAPPHDTSRPGPQGFARAVLAAAATRAEGWAGNRRAYIAQTFDALAERYAGWALNEIEFKAMLVQLHRLGLVSLMTADLKDKNRLADIERSAVTYKNTIWHYVRVEE